MILTIDDSHKIRIKEKGLQSSERWIATLYFLSEIHSEMDAWIFS